MSCEQSIFDKHSRESLCGSFYVESVAYFEAGGTLVAELNKLWPLTALRDFKSFEPEQSEKFVVGPPILFIIAPIYRL